MEDFMGRIAGLGVSGNVILAGYVTDEELHWLYSNCFANIYPSLFEGFGLPVLEGMQLGAPTICSSSTSLPEVAGDAALMVEPSDVAGWTSAMLHMQTESGLRDDLAARARARAGRFDWRHSAEILRSVYEVVASRGKLNEGACREGAGTELSAER